MPAEQEEQFENLNDINEAQGRGDKEVMKNFWMTKGVEEGEALNKWIKYTTLFINYKELYDEYKKKRKDKLGEKNGWQLIMEKLNGGSGDDDTDYDNLSFKFT